MNIVGKCLGRRMSMPRMGRIKVDRYGKNKKRLLNPRDGVDWDLELDEDYNPEYRKLYPDWKQRKKELKQWDKDVKN